MARSRRSRIKQGQLARFSTMLFGLALLAACASPPGAVPSPGLRTTESPSATAEPSIADQPTASPEPGPSERPGVVSCTYRAYGEPARPADPPPTTNVPAAGKLTVTLNMSEGPVTITMDRAKAPCTVNSFETLARQGFYDNTSCHRLVEQGLYFLQCGDPTGTGSGGPGYRFDDELTGAEAYPAGTVAMANNGPNTNGSQFFIVWADSDLPPTSTVFGEVEAGSLGVVTTIASRGISGEHSPQPVSPAVIEQVSLG